MKNILSKNNFYFLILITQFLFLNLFNTEYSIKSLLFSSFSTLAIFLYLNITEKKVSKIDPKITIITLCYLLFSLISFFLSQTPNLGLAEVTSDTVFLTLFLTLISIPKSKFNLTKATIYIAKANILLQSSYVFYQTLFAEQTRAFGSFLSYTDHRLIYPNALGLSLVLSILAILPTDKSQKNTLGLISIGFTSLLFSFSRGAILSLLIPTIIYASYLIYKHQKNILKKITLSFLIGFVLFIIPFQILPKFQSSLPIDNKITFAGTEKITSFDERLQFFTETPKLAIQKPILGFGPNSFSYIFPSVQKIPLSNSQHPHNIFLKIITERGLTNLLFFLAFLSLVTISAYKSFKQNPATLPLTLSLFGLLLHNSIDYNLQFPINSLLIILISSSLIPKKTAHTSKLHLSIFPIIFIFTTSYLFLNHLTLKKPDLSPLNISDINYQNSIQLHTNSLPDLNSKIDYLSNQTQNNPHNSFLYNQLAHLYLQNNQHLQAIQHFQKSIQIDSKNFWNPYNFLIQTINKYDPQLIQPILPSTIINLTQYQQAAQLNLHYTSQSDNILQAIQTCQNILTNPYLTQDQQTQVQNILSVLLSSHERFNRS